MCVVWHGAPVFVPPAQHEGVAHSQPSVSGGEPALQSEWFASHVYEQLSPLHAAAVALFGVHTSPHALQLLVVLVGVSQPSVFGAVVVQSAQPDAHTYEHVVPLQLAVATLVLPQATPHAPQLEVEVSEDSQPSVSGLALLQSAYPVSHPV